MNIDSQEMAARLRAAGATEAEGRYTLAGRPALLAGARLATPAEYLLKFVQSAVCAGAKKITIEGSRYGTAFMHDGAAPGGTALADLLLRPPSPPAHRAARALHALGVGLDVCISAGASVEVNAKQEDAIIRVEFEGERCVVDPTASGRFASHWSLRVMVKGLKIDHGVDVGLVRHRCLYAPAAVLVDERPINVARFGGLPLGVAQVLRGQCITCLLPAPYFAGCYPRDRHLIELRWLPSSVADGGGLCLPQPSEACLTLERTWDEETWPLIDDPGEARADAERNRNRRFFLVTEVEEQRRLGIYRGAVAMRPRADRGPRLHLTVDGVTVEGESLDDELEGIEALLALDDLEVEPSQFRLVHGRAYQVAMEDLRMRARLLERVLEYEFEGTRRDDRVAHALSGRAGARILRW